MEEGSSGTQPLLSGETSTLSASTSSASPLGVSPSNVEFVTGPDGQAYAVMKEPFVWKQFFIGFGVPMLFMSLPIILISIAGSIMPGDPYEYHDVTLNKVNGTAYEATFMLGDDVFFQGCQSVPKNALYWCHADDNDENWDEYMPSEQKLVILEFKSESDPQNDHLGGVVGNWTRSTGVLQYDDGSDEGDERVIIIETEIDYTEDDDYNTANTLQAFSGILCCGFPIIGLVMTAIGFSSGRKALGVGGAIALASFPFVGFAFFMFSIEMVGI
ncbi:MAG: hypothetical protein VX320_00160 [Candidatus Thermoplasmatota archaeon]|nr:hypothetical protein [Candidatus Thermoplasmatota archaeon]